MTNLITVTKFQSEVKSFGITEIFIIEGELYITSNYSLDYELISKLENELLN
jgi:hypothetical protein